MRTYDFSPLFRSTIGFDRLTNIMDTAMRQSDATEAYPPYNIQKTGENSYCITLAVAGFSEEELEIVSHEGKLVIEGRVKPNEENKENIFLHRGIAGRAFKRSFQLADHIKIMGANLSNGLLNVELVREIPEELKPRKIEISSSPKTRIIEAA
ncbi:MAG: Hsp20 family protein [Pseudomonadota bacterium]|nr:Hsp20 family protein [Pseudomonadota bacterium]